MNTEKVWVVFHAPQRICAFILSPKTIEVAQSHFMVGGASRNVNVPLRKIESPGR